MSPMARSCSAVMGWVVVVMNFVCDKAARISLAEASRYERWIINGALRSLADPTPASRPALATHFAASEDAPTVGAVLRRECFPGYPTFARRLDNFFRPEKN